MAVGAALGWGVGAALGLAVGAGLGLAVGAALGLAVDVARGWGDGRMLSGGGGDTVFALAEAAPKTSAAPIPAVRQARPATNLPLNLMLNVINSIPVGTRALSLLCLFRGPPSSIPPVAKLNYAKR